MSGLITAAATETIKQVAQSNGQTLTTSQINAQLNTLSDKIEAVSQATVNVNNQFAEAVASGSTGGDLLTKMSQTAIVSQVYFLFICHLKKFYLSCLCLF